MFVRCSGQSSFEWRAPTGRWRWIILGALGVAPAACGGRTDPPPTDGRDVNLQGGGGAAGSTSTPSPSSGGRAGSGGASVAGTGSGGSSAVSTPTDCEPPLTDLGGGWERCGNGMIHRSTLATCSSSLPRAEPAARPYPNPPGTPDAGLPGECRDDSECTARAHGHCAWEPYIGAMHCRYGCVSNADCEPGNACLCGDPVGACHPATCSVDADCGEGSLCSDFRTDPGCGEQAFACQQATDACAADSDCPENEFCVRGNYPDPVPPGAPSFCSPAQCIIGRPFLIAGDERLASPIVRSDWYTGSSAPLRAGALVRESRQPCDGADDRCTSAAELRDAVAAGWLEQALMEHASVAAFARFSLQLLALGAPADLCAESASATRDEVEHARACFELARRHSNADVGPGPLDLTGAFEATDLEAIVLGTIVEGCIGETVAAIEAAEALAHCTDEAACPVLERIARDETRHAELAWRFVAWALEVGPAALRERVQTAFTEADRGVDPGAAPSARDRQLLRHGLMAPSLRAELRCRVLRDVIQPCARALLDGAQPAARGVLTAAVMRGVAPLSSGGAIC